MLALRDLAPDGFFIIDLAAVSAEIIPLGVGIFRDAHVRGANVTVGIGLMMNRHRQLQHIDLVAFENVIENRPGLHDLRLDQLHLGHAVMVSLDDAGLAFVLQRQPQG